VLREGICIALLTFGFKTVAAAAGASKLASAVPIIFGVSAAVSAATGLTSTGLQIAQHIQYQDQLKDQQELVQLQKELGRRQLAQYIKAEQAEEKESKMYSKPATGIGPVNMHQMQTRSMARNPEMIRMQNLRNTAGTPAVVNMADFNMNQTATPRGGAFENISLNSPRMNNRRIGGSLRQLADGEEIALARGNTLMVGSGSSNTLFDEGIGGLARNRGVNAQEVAMRLETLGTRDAQDITQSVPNIMRVAGDQEIRYRGAAFNRLLDKVRLSTGRVAPLDQYMHFANDGGRFPSVRRAFMRAIQKHKRKLLIGGAVIGTAALLAGSIYGGITLDNHKLDLNQYLPSASTKKALDNHKQELNNHQYLPSASTKKAVVKKDKIKEEMQYDKPAGVFEKMSNNSLSSGDYVGGGGGGGGSSSGGGYGNYQKAYHQLANKVFGGKTHRKKRRSSKKSTTPSKTRKTKHGKVTKRMRVNKKHINKQAKRTKKGRKHTAAARKKAF
jgi:hypothetical protein